ncbi:uncharacterized protein LOC111715246 [Eurytemora carolleeae]|uniref:uncharacterized protein LOC111715246 n=1 Tax=Eurytemora carolleeae TaxID=1294199 RepID=UPI000C78088A|nr:uncharacterized protein LOC111715246 [Eurytemora carolleeae]|eukprot:XP_023346321.1 uncharacterized protein LOC111715246 [Eurytemora affinis]
MSDIIEIIRKEDVLDIFRHDTDVRVDGNLTGPDILPKKIGPEEARCIDLCLDMMDAISIIFLITGKVESSLVLCKSLEQSGKNEVATGLGNPSGVVYLFWYSANLNNDTLWEAKLCETLYLTNNMRILNDFGLTPEEAKMKFKQSYLDPTAVNLYNLCRDITEKERIALTKDVPLNSRYLMLETQILQYVHQQKILMNHFLPLLIQHLPKQHPFILQTSVPARKSVRADHYPKGPGYVVIINQKTFTRDPWNPASKSLESRLGTDIDRDRLNIVFTYLGARKISIFNNLNLKDMREKLDECARYADEHHAEFAWLCVCILSHGGITRCGKNEVYACDGLPMDRKEIIMKFADKSSVKNFYGKPKIFVFQACRTPTDQGSDDIDDNKRFTQMIRFRDNEVSTDCLYPPINHGDYVVCSSTIEDFVTFRHTEMGSFYIRFVSSIQAYRDRQLLYQVCEVYSGI